MNNPNLLAAVQPVHEVLKNSTHPYACVGGLVTDVLLYPKTVIDPLAQQIYADTETHIPLLRPNGTARDIDLLLLTQDGSEIAFYLDQLLHNVTPHVPVSTISLSGYDRPTPSPSLQVVSRTVQEHDNSLWLQMGATRQLINIDDLEETWTLNYRDASIATLHPVAHLMSYRTRSITGVRHKDTEKVASLEKLIAGAFSSDDIAQFENWRRFEKAIEHDYSFHELLSHPSRLKATYTLARLALQSFEKSAYLTTAVQSEDGFIAAIAKRVMILSKPSFYSHPSTDGVSAILPTDENSWNRK